MPSIIRAVTWHLYGTLKSESDSINEFLLNEAVSNEYGLWSISLDIMVYSKKTDFGPELENRYKLYSNLRDENWKENVIMAMLQLNYSKPTDLYHTYIETRLNAKSKSHDNFFLLVNYTGIDPKRGIDFLSDYYVERLRSRTCSAYSDHWRLGYLIRHFIINQPRILFDLIEHISHINHQTSILLTEMMILHLEMQSIDNVNKEKINDIRDNLMLFLDH